MELIFISPLFFIKAMVSIKNRNAVIPKLYISKGVVDNGPVNAKKYIIILKLEIFTLIFI